MVCTFFGHRNAPSGVRVALEAVLIDLIENKGADVFYVGNHGGAAQFQGMARRKGKIVINLYEQEKR